jgi:hypothetical protein
VNNAMRLEIDAGTIFRKLAWKKATFSDKVVPKTSNAPY